MNPRYLGGAGRYLVHHVGLIRLENAFYPALTYTPNTRTEGAAIRFW